MQEFHRYHFPILKLTQIKILLTKKFGPEIWWFELAIKLQVQPLKALLWSYYFFYENLEYFILTINKNQFSKRFQRICKLFKGSCTFEEIRSSLCVCDKKVWFFKCIEKPYAFKKSVFICFNVWVNKSKLFDLI